MRPTVGKSPDTAMANRWRWSVQTLALLAHCTTWAIVTVTVTIATPTHIPPGELWAALPAGISTILLIFRGDSRPRDREDSK